MKTPKIKTYVLMVAKHYPPRVRKAIERRFKDQYLPPGRATQTDFKQKIKNVLSRKSDAFPDGLIDGDSGTAGIYGKIHTCRANYQLWKKRIADVNRGNAVISVRQWSGRPYNSKQHEFAILKRGQVGIQRCGISANAMMVLVDGEVQSIKEFSHNDGLTVMDFMSWFKSKQVFTGCVIHFTSFRYK